MSANEVAYHTLQMTQAISQIASRAKQEEQLELLIKVYEKYAEIFKSLKHKDNYLYCKKQLFIYKGLNGLVGMSNMLSDSTSLIVLGGIALFYYFTGWSTISILGIIGYCKFYNDSH